MYKEKKSLCIVNGIEKGFFSSKTYSDKELDIRIEMIWQNISKIMNTLILITNSTNFENHHLKLFILFSENSGVLPKSFMFDFELRRLNFSYYATLKYNIIY